MNKLNPAFDVEKLYADIENGTLKLPPMPDWAFKIQRMLDDMNVSTDQIVATVSRDPTFVAQLFKSANSAAYAGKPKVNTAKSAITRIGFKALRNLVMSISMNNLSKTNNPTVGKFLSSFWLHSREVAAISYLLSKSQPHLNQDQAMLAGLIHDIGTLPLCINAGKIFPNINENDLSLIVRKYSAQVGEKMLQEWGFPLEMTVIPIAHENFQIKSDSEISNYSDIVTIANLLNRVTAKTVNWENISAVQRLGLDVEIYQDFFERFDTDITNARSMLEV